MKKKEKKIDKIMLKGKVGEVFHITDDVDKVSILMDVTELGRTKIPTDANPRSQKMTCAAVQGMLSTLDKRDVDFPVMNGGVKIIAESVDIDPDGGKYLVLNISDTKNQGVIDGGHTYRAIERLILENPDYEKGIGVFVDVIYGKHPVENSVKIASARNTASQVSLTSIMHAEGKFDCIKDTIKDLPFHHKVRYEENGHQPIKVELLLALMQLFNIESYGSKTFGTPSKNQPCDAYNSFTNCAKRFNTAYNKAGGVEGTIYGKLIPMLPDLIELFCYVEENLAKFYKDGGGCYGLLTVKKGEKKRTIASMKPDKNIFTDKRCSYYTPQAWVMPILTVARGILRDDGDELSWAYSPYEFFEVAGPAAAHQFLSNLSKNGGKDNNSYLKSSDAWKAAYMAGMNAFLANRMS